MTPARKLDLASISPREAALLIVRAEAEAEFRADCATLAAHKDVYLRNSTEGNLRAFVAALRRAENSTARGLRLDDINDDLGEEAS